MTDKQIKSHVEAIVPLDHACESNRRSQVQLRARLHGVIQDMVREYPQLFQPQFYDPRTSDVYKPELKIK